MKIWQTAKRGIIFNIKEFKDNLEHFLSIQLFVHWALVSLAASSLNLLRRWTVALAVRAAAVDTYQAPPATVFLQALHFHMPTASLLTVSYEKLKSNKTYLSAEGASIGCTLSDFELFDGFSLSSSISSSVLSADSDLLCSLCHYSILIND